MLDVAIVGGGPAGLAAAIALRRAAPRLSVKVRMLVAGAWRGRRARHSRVPTLLLVSSKVFERAPALTPRGATLALVPNGLKALRALDGKAAAAVEAVDLADVVRGCRVSTTTGATLDDSPGRRADRTAHLGRSLTLLWHELRDTLAGEVGPDAIALAHGLSSLTLDTDGGGATLEFGGELPSVRTRAVVGADGGRSLVRAALLPAEGPLTYGGLAVWRGVRPSLPPGWDTSRAWQAIRDDTALPAGAAAGPRAAFLSYVLPPAPGDSEPRLVWQLFAPWPEARLGELSAGVAGLAAALAGSPGAGRARLDRALSALAATTAGGLAGWPAAVVDAVEATDAAAVAEHPLLWRPAAVEALDAIPPTAPATLVGDAHALGPPMLGQGTAQAVEGALALGAALAGAGPETDLAPRLRLYEASRRERAAAILAARIDVTERGARGGRVDEVGEHLALGFMEATFDPL
jgi:2-polyprenyl-6-methoxyphenol hydroxylase-like FAD-dependent oxidoreductase